MNRPNQISPRLLTSAVAFLGMLLLSPLAGAESYSLSSKWLNHHVGVIAIPAYEGPVVQTNMSVQFNNGLSFGALWFTDVEDGGKGQFSSTKGDELDWFAGWKTGIGAGFDLEAQLYYIDLKELMDGHQGDILRLVVELSHPLSLSSHKLTPFIAFWGNRPAQAAKPERGAQYVGGLRHLIPLPMDFSFNHDVELRQDEGFASSEPDAIVRYNSSVNWKYNQNFTLNPLIVRFSAPVTASKQRESEWVFGFGASYQFQ